LNLAKDPIANPNKSSARFKVSLKSVGSRRSSHVPSRLEDIEGAVGKRMNPLPPIEQYGTYSNNSFFLRDQAKASSTLLPIKRQTLEPAPEKKERDRMVAKIYADKQQMLKSLEQGTKTSSFK